ncbi:hypothetical protein ACGFXB_24945 [Streptomyces canus]|uniref:hypothetical protein n=1 Tax=Streptomyces canus TaxID=58343 RepID=UPI003711E8D2
MSVQPIPLHQHRRRVDEQQQLDAVEATIAYLNLPAARPPVYRDDAVHVIVTAPDEFSQWVYHLGGDVHHGAEVDGASLMSLCTETPAGRGGAKAPLRVHVPLVHGEKVLADLRGAASA